MTMIMTLIFSLGIIICLGMTALYAVTYFFKEQEMNECEGCFRAITKPKVLCDEHFKKLLEG